MSYNFTSGSTTHIGDFTALGFVKAKSDEVSGSTVVVGGGGLSIAGVAVSATAT